MTTPKDDGGPAYPARPENGVRFGMSGMTLRDYFAAQAMACCVLSPSGDPRVLSRIAACAYQMADAMIAARKS